MTTVQERLVVSVEEAGLMLGLGRSAAYDAVKRGDIPTIRIGRRILVPKRALEKMLDDGQERSEDADEVSDAM